MADYGSIAEVVAFTRHLLDGGTTFSSSTRPTDTEVIKFLERTSAILNGALATEGFDTPVTNASVKPALDDWVIERATQYVELTQRGTGYGEGEGSRTISFGRLAGDALDFVSKFALGWARLGAARSYSKSAGLSFTAIDAQGQRTDRSDTSLEQPLFERRQWDDTGTSDFSDNDDED